MIAKVVKELKELKEKDSRARDIKSVSLTNNGDLLIGYRHKGQQLVIDTTGLKVADVVQKALAKAKAEKTAGGNKPVSIVEKVVTKVKKAIKKK